MTHEDAPTFEPMRKPDMPPMNRNRPRPTLRRTVYVPQGDDSPYLETGDRLEAMDKMSWIDRVRERKNRSANGEG